MTESSNVDAIRQEQLLVDATTRVTCPRCDHEFSLADGFARKSLEELAAASHGALAQLREQARNVEERRAQERAAHAESLLREKIADLQSLMDAQRKQHQQAVEQARALEKEAAQAREKSLQEALQQRATRAEALAVQVRANLEEEIRAQKARIQDFQAVELKLRKERADLEARQQQFELDVQRRMDGERRRIEEAARTAEAEKSKYREAELQKKLDDTLGKLNQTQRQLEQGSQQLQGEVLELLLEEELTASFPFDSIVEVKKGARGADALHRVMTRLGQDAGTILWEAKRAQKWSAQWPAKLKEDMRDAGAETAVIVTTSFPNDWPSGQLFGLYAEIWVTTPSAAIAMAAVLRVGLLDAHKARVAGARKGEKMEAVYDYLTSPQFAHKLRAVYDAFKKMREELEGERTVMQQRWRRREKQIGIATSQLIGIAGDLQGLAQQDLPQLELEPRALEELEPEEQEEVE
jgi:hypothetical protein